jgi:hypothetical protein
MGTSYLPLTSLEEWRPEGTGPTQDCSAKATHVPGVACLLVPFKPARKVTTHCQTVPTEKNSTAIAVATMSETSACMWTLAWDDSAQGVEVKLKSEVS